MPHQCTGCGHTFEDGSKEMLSGCPECGGNKFQFRPDAADFEEATAGAAADEASAPEPDRPDSSSVAETVGRATTKMRDLVSSSEPPSTDDAAPLDDDFGTPASASRDETATTANTSRDEPTTAEPTAEGALESSSGTEPKPESEQVGDSSDRPDPNASWPDQSAPPDSMASSSTGEETPSFDDEESSGSDIDTDSEIIDADARRDDEEIEEDIAQASARSSVVSEDELEEVVPEKKNEGADTDTSAPERSGHDSPAPDSDGRVVSEPNDEEPDISDLREQLNDQFESIKIVEPGQYELNLMELYDREEYIIALQENGRYMIQVPEQWMGEDPGDR